ncbi:alpha-2-macroglobulin family protein [Neolewinella lacunae]|uniref:Alpha-2-macroglobulin domain-containing protein n=1 Tax=Neolewinella lacunae TaxID=1517758 RepID=A0A923PIE3_9BACT|nr:alpha-2-macroglobulin family protein [Neolewinella lacunae]MBC6993854.1 hypothetical protein [Neolewinella lacunae]MDN3637085.1 alpha-2-macroglobulin family protein [Neolewinella lacunae]
MRYLLLGLLLAATTILMAQDYQTAYQNIDKLGQEGKYRSALEAAEQLYQRAEREGDQDDMLKSLAYRAAYTFQLEEDGYDASLRLLQTELAENTNRPVVAAVLHFLLGQGYYNFAQQNAYRLRNATATTRDSVPSPTTPLADWNLQQLADAANHHLLTALELAAKERTRLTTVPAIVKGEEAGMLFTPTLYDLMVQTAMGILGNPLLSVGNPTPSNTERFWVPAAEFVELDLSDLDSTSGNARQLRLHQDLLRYHLGSGGTPLLGADLQRIEFLDRLGVSDSLYLATLDALYRAYANVPGRDLILVRKAQRYNRSDDQLGPRPKAKALEILAQIKEKLPFVTAAAETLRREITWVDLQATVQETYGKGENLLFFLNYRNVGRVYHRLVKLPDDWTESGRYDTEQKRIDALRKLPLAARADFRLPDNDDYEGHNTESWIKAQAAGRYCLLTSTGQEFDLAKETVVVNFFQVSNLALVKFNDGEKYYYEVVDRSTGAPRAGVEVTVRRLSERRNGDWTTVNTFKTGADGRIPNPDVNQTQIQFFLKDAANDDRYTSEPIYAYRNDRPDRNRKTPFTPLFTDRAIYRPGQTVHVYGITWIKDQREMPTMLTGETRTLTLRDANYQEAGKAEVTSDAYSRFNHSFKLPAGGLTGNFRIETEGGSVSFRVEEYKRPRFVVKLDGPDFALAGQETTVEGKATLFAGPGLNDAKVNYRVFVEEVRWYWWSRGGGGGDRELVASGSATTDGDGAFTVTFTPAEGLQQKRARYQYVIEADVSDATGETHEASTTVGLRGEKPLISLQIPAESYDISDSLTILANGTDEALTVLYRIVPVTKPGIGLRSRQWPFPDRPLLDTKEYLQRFPELPSTPTLPLEEWPAKNLPVPTGEMQVADGKGSASVDLSKYAVGHYRLEWTYPDGTKGEPLTFQVMDLAKGELAPGQRYYLDGLDQEVKVGQPITLTFVGGVEIPRITYGWASRRGYVHATTSANRRTTITYLPTEEDRGGIQFFAAFLRLNQLTTISERFTLDWENKKLRVEYATFRAKLRPGQPERWTLTISNADSTPIAAAALASMYDASLDQIYAGGRWNLSAFPFYYGYRDFAEQLQAGTNSGYGFNNIPEPSFPDALMPPVFDFGPLDFLNYGRYEDQLFLTSEAPRGRGDMAEMRVQRSVAKASPSPMAASAPANYSAEDSVPPPPPPPAPGEGGGGEDAPVQIRTNLQETAFWLPELTSDDSGRLTVSFNSPEALTSWTFRLLAHDKNLASVISQQTIVTQKELMVLPNVPRFVREGDALSLTARVNNLTDTALLARVQLELFNPITGEAFPAETMRALNAGAGDCPTEQSVSAQAGSTFCFNLSIPEGFSTVGPVGYRIIARGGAYSDGEENVFPVLSDRTLITVSQPFYLKRKEKKTIELPLLASNRSNSLQHVGYTFQATTNPAWLALKALPYLMEYPYDCTEQLANRYFANQLAYTTVSSKPILEQVFRQWQRDSNALKSELERNPQLKNALLTETPWLREAESEAAQRARIGDLFDLKKLADEQTAALEKLAQRQDASGYFSWFPGGRENRYMTQYVVETLGRLRQLDVVSPDQKARVSGISKSAIAFLDEAWRKEYVEYLRQTEKTPDQRKDYQPSSTVVHYLYARAMHAAAPPQDDQAREALAFYTTRTKSSWTKYGLYEQALLVATATKTGDRATATTIVASLRERALHKDEFGMFWKYGQGYTWQQLPIETHCRLLEAFQLAGGTTEELDEMRLWLLTNKRTNRWETTKASAAAVFALLNGGTNWTESEGEAIRVEWPDFAARDLLSTRVRALQNTPEAATGAFSLALPGSEVNSGLATVRVKNQENRLVWGGVYWQYTELATKVAGSNDGPLTLDRELFRRIATADGVRLEPITADAPLAPGDRVTVRLILRSDRDLDYVHLKDRRAATFEPITQISGYQYRNGLGYYFAPGDLATNFFIDHLPRGTYTLEYDLFATHKGSFSNGLGRVQCMYAPEFGANTAGARIVVE